MKAGKRKISIKWEISDYVMIVLQCVFSLFFAYLVKKVLPFKYWIIIVVVLGLFCWLTFCELRALIRRLKTCKRRKTMRKVNYVRLCVKIFSGILSFVLFLGCVVANQGFSALGQITGEQYQVQIMSVIVKEESSYQELKDLQGKKLGYVQGLDEKNRETAITEMKNQEGVSFEEMVSDSGTGLAQALLEGTTDAILLNEAYRGIVEDTYGTFSSDTRVIYEYKIQQEIQRTESEVNVVKEPFSIYLSGIDTYGPVSTMSRSDVNMVVTVNPQTKKILMTSIPRDYYVELASFGSKDKLTHAGIYGVEESMGTIENLMGIQIDYYAKVNFTSLITIVDALDGITVYNSQEFVSYHTHDFYPEGEIEMDGETALEFVRERYGLANGDNDRIKNQQKVLAALIDKAISPAIIVNYSELLEVASDAVVTSMSSKDIQKIIQMQISDMASWDIEQISLTGTGSSSASCYSMPGKEVYVMEPEYESVEAASARIQQILAGK